MKEKYDVLIIGGGVIGCCAARELAKYNINIALIEKHEDVACETSKANSGMIHGGYDAKFTTVKGQLSALGNKLFDELDNELHFGFRRCGSMVLAFDDEDIKTLEDLKANGEKNGVETEIIDIEEILKIEPNISPKVKKALYCKTAGVSVPFEYTVAMAENAIDNGVDFFFNEEVINIEKKDNIFFVKTKENTYKADYVINAAGVYADEISKMICTTNFKITPRRGEYMLFDKNTKGLVNSVIFPVPKAGSKGIAITPALHGNIMIGPDAEFIKDKTDTDTKKEVLDMVWNDCLNMSKKLDKSMVITQFAGLRASSEADDFVIEESDTKGFINAACICSPGFTVSYAIALKLAGILKDAGLKMEKRDDFNPNRKPYVHIDELSKEEFNELIKQDSRYGRVICRCETITEGQIVDVMHRGIKITNPDSVKRRIRAGMGRCQGGFCLPRVMEIIERENNIPYDKIPKNNEKAYILNGRTQKGVK